MVCSSTLHLVRAVAVSLWTEDGQTWTDGRVDLPVDARLRRLRRRLWFPKQGCAGVGRSVDTVYRVTMSLIC